MHRWLAQGALTSMAFMLAALAGCSTTQQYTRAVHALHTEAPHLWCWTSTASLSPTYHGARCSESTDADLAEAQCIKTLSDAATHRPGVNSAKRDVESCMRDEGWSLFPLAFYLQTHDTRNCRVQDDPLVWCPDWE
ncbi:hypothetical protein LYSHEL_23020 [Lysobacter helvus]|uniref:Lipoprotein n=2 Tax=Lysobacteraceae TaxID=32033 RepID=A0ABM7Q7A2_9GAMM|nr:MULTISPECIES: hypothetical protein [Lysobacter]BCT93278.1 hypothetical protein LYSCAS_23020 [Lysobacter caseinilyticus]BCT96431.1 hypothetical protein LYSHEL_23020 [Lysobacter helvus]